MTLTNARLRSALAGASGGLLAWAIIEPLVVPLLDRPHTLLDLMPVDFLFGCLAGIVIGLALGVAEGLIVRSLQQAVRGALLGAGIGFVGGGMGLVFGELVYQPLAVCLFLGRSVGWGVFGAALGFAQGLTRRSLRGARNATLGGLIGGLVGGIAFDLLGLIIPSAIASRAAALTLVGACIGVLIVVLAKALADGSLKITSGRFEGLEFMLDKSMMSVGSITNADVAVPGDPQVLPSHATIRHHAGQHVIEARPGAPLWVNGELVSQRALVHEDQLLLGATRLIYKRRGAAAPALAREEMPQAASRDAPRPAPSPPGAPAALDIPHPASPPPRAAAPVVTQPTALLNLHTGQRFTLYTLTTLGRDLSNQIILNSPAAAPRHAEIRYEGGRFILYDLSGGFGAFVNGRQIVGPNMLKVGFRVRVGDVEFEVV